jgi:ribosomal protein L32
MAVPKKRTSKIKTRLRKAQWKAQASRESLKALSKAKTVIKALLVETSTNSEPSTESSN